MRCPGQDLRYWTFEDIYNLACPECGHPVEFFKDDIRRNCNHCGHDIINPKKQLGCAETCLYADQCQNKRAIK